MPGVCGLLIGNNNDRKDLAESGGGELSVIQENTKLINQERLWSKEF